MAALAADPLTVQGPAYHAGDSWVLFRTTQRGNNNFTQQRTDLTIDRVDADSMVVNSKPDGSALPPQGFVVGLDWTDRFLADGQQQVRVRPLAFPMRIGDSWTVDFTDPRRRGNQNSIHLHTVYKVVGWEDVTVQAGTFHALKVEAHGTGAAQVSLPAVASSTSVAGSDGGTSVAQAQVARSGVVQFTNYDAYYYVPEVKLWVKHVDEQYDTSNVRIVDESQELVSFKLAP